VPEAPDTHYAAVGDAQVAYQVVGEGPLDLLYFYGLGSHIELIWEWPLTSQFFWRLASFSRLIMFDRRGTGASDPVPSNAPPTWEEWTEDVGAVLDAAESAQAVLFASIDCGPIAILFTAMHPERVSALVLFNTAARYMADDDYPIGASTEDTDAVIKLIEAQWGEGLAALTAPSLADDPERLRRLGRQLRACATPRSAAAQFDHILRGVDVRKALPLVQVPTLILHVRDNPFVPIAHGRYLAEHIPGATLVELPGDSTGLAEGSDQARVADEIALFLTGERPAIDVDRILTTVLFTDIVGSTQRASQMGDGPWRSVLDAHDNVIRDQLRRFRGREINTTGDGFVASFDGPARAIRCAQAIVESNLKNGIELRVGLHTGECEVRGDDLGGLAVHIAARVGSLALPGETFVSGTVKDLVVGSGIEFEERGEHDLNGVPGTWKLFAVKG
jgi:class 3 adenylate cyclase